MGDRAVVEIALAVQGFATQDIFGRGEPGSRQPKKGPHKKCREGNLWRKRQKELIKVVRSSAFLLTRDLTGSSLTAAAC